MKIVLLGKDGQVGSELRRSLLPLGQVIAVGRRELCLENLSGLNQFLNEQRPHLIVNAAAYTAVDKAETDQTSAFILNEKVVSVLADYAKRSDALLVHYSTDYVFDGEKNTPYLETDNANPQNVYGASKWAGEQALHQSGCRFLNFRTSWVFSITGHNFIKTILKLAKEKDNLRVVADQYGAPTSAEMIADVTALAIANDLKGRIEAGTYHLTAAGKTSWYALACYAVEHALMSGASLKLQVENIYPISTDEYPLPAKRPQNSILDSSMLSNVLGLYRPDWSVYVDRMLDYV